MSSDRLRTAIVRGCSALALVVTMATVAAAQSTVGTADVQRLQDEVYQINSDLTRLRSTNADMAARLQTELDDLGEEVIYLKVKLRREGTLTRGEYADVRDRLQDVRSRARNESTTRGSGTRGGVSGSVPSGTTGGVTGGVAGGVAGADPEPGMRRSSGDTTIPVGYEIDVRLQNELSSSTAQVEDRFEATTVSDVYSGSRVLIPAGSEMRGVIRSVDKATRTDRKGELTVSFDQVTIRGRSYPLRGTVTQALESEGLKGEATRIGAGSAVGAIIGGIIGGVKGALLGVLIGGGGTIAATEGKDVTLPPGTILRVRFDTPPDIR
jgi:hypothetical protein